MAIHAILAGVANVALSAVADKALDAFQGPKNRDEGKGESGGIAGFLAKLVPFGPLGGLLSLGRGAGKEEV